MPRAQFHTRTETKSKKATVAMSPFFHAWKIAINVVVNVQHVFLFYFCTNDSTCFIIHPPPHRKLIVCECVVINLKSKTTAMYCAMLCCCRASKKEGFQVEER